MGVNDMLDVNNPAHKIIIEINNRHEQMYGEFHDECRLFKAFCQCDKTDKNVKENYEQTR